MDQDGKLCGVDYPDYPAVYYLVQVVVPGNPLVQSGHPQVMTGRNLADYTLVTNAVCINSCPLN